MFDRTIRTYPVGDKIRGTNLYYNSSTGNSNWSECRKCILCNGRRRVCVRRDGIRNFDSVKPIRLLFIGEAPGATEDGTGIPFTGHSGRVLDQIFQYTTTAFEFCITNIICCRPKDVTVNLPNNIDSEEQLTNLKPIYEYSNFNRNPNPTEIIACQPHIDEIIKSYKPQGIVYLGNVARNSYLTNRKTIHLVHPAYIVRQEYKVRLMRIEARKIYNFIKELKGETT